MLYKSCLLTPRPRCWPFFRFRIRSLSSLLNPNRTAHSFVLRARLGYLYSAGRITGRLLAFANASITCASESVLIVVPIDMKKLFLRSVFAKHASSYSKCVPKSCSRTCHVLPQCSHHAIWTWTKSDDVCCSEYKANNETDGCSDVSGSFSSSSRRRFELTATHHCAHFDCRVSQRSD